MVAIASIGTSFAITSPNPVSAVQNTGEKILANNEMQTNNEIEDAKVPIEHLVNLFVKNQDNYYPDKVQGVSFERKKTLNYSINFRFKADGSSVITSSENVYVGIENLTNNTATEQVLTTQSFTKSLAHTVTSSTTHGFKFGTKATAKLVYLL